MGIQKRTLHYRNTLWACDSFRPSINFLIGFYFRKKKKKWFFSFFFNVVWKLIINAQFIFFQK